MHHLRTALLSGSPLSALLLAAVSGLSCSDSKSQGSFFSESAACEAFSACGGDPEGSWQLDGICVDNPSAQFTMLANQSSACSGFLTGYQAQAAGSATFGASGALTGKLTLKHEFDVRITSACMSAIVGQPLSVTAADCRDLAQGIRDELGYTSARCERQGDACECTFRGDGKVDLSGGFQRRDSALFDPRRARSYPFCESGDALTIAKVEVGGDLTATLSFRRRE